MIPGEACLVGRPSRALTVSGYSGRVKGMEKEAPKTTFQKEAQRWLEEGRVGDIDFSGRTYQIQVTEPNGDEFWPFLQFGQDEELADAFCNCEAAEKQATCIHLSSALLRLYQGHHTPLHVRFQQSLWNCLCYLFARRQGYAATLLEKIGEGRYRLKSVGGKTLFLIGAHHPEACARLTIVIEKRIIQTEENSLKFSGLSVEELVLWREGRPSVELQYELSFWSDLAKWMFLLQDSGSSYSIRYTQEGNAIPCGLTAFFDDLEVEFYLSQANLPLIIPALATVTSPLVVHQTQDEAIGEITYDRETGSFHVGQHRSASESQRLHRQAWYRAHSAEYQSVDGWLYVPGDGFYAREQALLDQDPVIDASRIEAFLDSHEEMLRTRLRGERVHREPFGLRYELWFDTAWRLHVRAYAIEPGDLQRGTSRSFGRWIYLEDDGFYPIHPPQFSELYFVIEERAVSEFIHRHRWFLGLQKGFSTRVTAFEAPLTYAWDSVEGLLFQRVTHQFVQGEVHEFGDWIYLIDKGFFPRRPQGSHSVIFPGLRVPLTEVALFIRSNQEELESVPHFFADRCPIVGMQLTVEVTAACEVTLKPEYQLHNQYQAAELELIGEYVYVVGEGFSLIPRHMLLPERFRQPRLLKGQELHLFLTYELDTLLPRISTLDPRLKRPTELELIAHDARPSDELRGLIALELAYQSRLGTAPLSELWKAQSQQQRYVFTGAGLIDLEESRFQWLRIIGPNRLDRRRNVVRMTALELIRLQAIDRLSYPPNSPHVHEFMESLLSFQSPDKPKLNGLKSELRPYQQLGLDWLWFLRSQGLSGLLCDDMGLGKTHQAMALMAAINNSFQANPSEEQPHYLVVCPTSVLYHWKEKIQAYLPQLRVHLFYGAGRQLCSPDEYDLLLTSYGILRSDQKRLAAMTFELAIYDEIQVAKNPSSRTHQALGALRSHMRLGLTGTPIENTLRELKSLFDLILPGYFPSESVFREQFTLPIERESNAEKQALLHRLVRPFILRRRKKEVLTELPGKTEEKAHCELSSQQRELYAQILTRSYADLLHELKDEKKRVNYAHIFSILTSLKRICDHPAVYLNEPENYQQYESGKWDLFCELLNQVRDSGQKLVVFSQYLSMIDIIKTHLELQGIGYAAIRGDTIDRQGELARFADDKRCEVFIGSLGAAALGVDLTAASVVIHYDRWWTKAREEQATDRVYRIGQTKGVQVFKLLTLGTIEDKIDAIIERKGNLMEQVVGSDNASQLKAFSREELIELFSTSV